MGTENLAQNCTSVIHHRQKASPKLSKPSVSQESKIVNVDLVEMQLVQNLINKKVHSSQRDRATKPFKKQKDCGQRSHVSRRESKKTKKTRAESRIVEIQHPLEDAEPALDKVPDKKPFIEECLKAKHKCNGKLKALPRTINARSESGEMDTVAKI